MPPAAFSFGPFHLDVTERQAESAARILSALGDVDVTDALGLGNEPGWGRFAAAHELLVDDARRVLEGAQRAGTDARLLVGRGMQHDWPLPLPWFADPHHRPRCVVSMHSSLAAPSDERCSGEATLTSSTMRP